MLRTIRLWILGVLGVAALAGTAGCVTEETSKSGFTNFKVKGGEEKADDVSSTYKSRIRQYEKKVESMPERSDFRISLAQAYYEDKQYEKAIETLKTALEKDPRNGEAHFRLGEFYLEMNRIAEAETCYRKAVQYSLPGYSGPHLALGYALAMQDKYQEAIGELQKVIAIDPAQPTALYYLGCCYDSAGVREKAIEHLERCATLESPYKEKATQELERLKLVGRIKSPLQAER